MPLVTWRVESSGREGPEGPCVRGVRGDRCRDDGDQDPWTPGRRGPPVLLLHGIPETHLMWHRVAPAIAERFMVVATDLRGFADSGTPPSAPDHAPHSMR